MTSKNICGYVQSLSPTKKSRTCQPYFHFNLQTGETETQRVVCLDKKLRANFQTYQTSKAPVKIKNASENRSRDSPDVLDIFIGKRAKVEAASTTEVPFLFHPVEAEQIIKATAADLQLIEPGQPVTIFFHKTVLWTWSLQVFTSFCNHFKYPDSLLNTIQCMNSENTIIKKLNCSYDLHVYLHATRASSPDKQLPK